MTFPPDKIVTNEEWQKRHEGHEIEDVVEVFPFQSSHAEKRMHKWVCKKCGAQHLHLMETVDLHQVKQAAIRDEQGEVHTLPRPARHHDIAHKLYEERGHALLEHDEQGFVLEDSTFVGREEAADYAVETGQIEKPKWPPDLYSEDLW